MKLDIIYLNDIVNELNLQLFELHGDQDYQFGFVSNGDLQMITYGSIQLWSSYEDDRKFDEEEDEYEDLTLFVKRKFNEYTESLQKIRF